MNMFMMNTMIVTSSRKSDPKIQYNKQGWIREYKSCGYQCENVQISKCTESKNHVKVITRHVWEKIYRKAEDIM